MRRVRAWVLRLVGSVTGSRRDDDLADELASHLQLHIDDNLRGGMTPDEARRAAVLKLGGVDVTKEAYRDRRGLPWLDGIVQDVRFSLGSLRRSPGFTAVAVAMLALGIGVNAAVFTVANALLFKGFGLVNGNNRILYIGTQKNGQGGGCCVSYPDFEDWRAQATSFDAMGAVADWKFTLRDRNGFGEAYDATRITANGFSLLGVKPVLGRDFTAADDQPGAPPVAILSYAFWERRYGKDPAIVGRTIRIDDTPTTVIGVMPQGFFFPQDQDLWVPLVSSAAFTPTGTAELQKREARNLWFAFGRLADGATFDGARAELTTIGHRLATAHPRTNEGWVPSPLTFSEFFVRRDATAIYGAMWAAVGFVLLIACVNLANLLLARSLSRSREISVRMALGAGRWRIVRQLLVESVLLSAAGGCLGWWLARWGVHAYALAANPPTSSWSDHLFDYAMDTRVLAYLTAISLGTGVLFGLTPALRLSKLDLNATLKDGGRSAGGGRRGKHLSATLVIAEVALAVVLLAGAGVMIRSFLQIYTADLGVNTDNILTMLLNLPDGRYSDAESKVAFFDRLRRHLDAIPGVESVAVTDALPTWGSPRRPYYELAGAPPVDAQRRPAVSALVISGDYFRLLGASLLSGRPFNGFDGPSTMPVVIVNQRFASQEWPGGNPLGRRLRLFDGTTPGSWLTVVGVAPNIAQNDPGRSRRTFDPLVYLPYRQRPAAGVWVLMRTRVPPGSLGSEVRREIQRLDPDLPIWLGPFSLTDRLAATRYWRTGTNTVLFLIFGAIALLLAFIGLYAVVAHAVSGRTQEIGVRMAIGATARDVVALVLRQGLLPVGIGLGIGLAASLAVNPVLKSQLVNVSPTDPAVLLVASVVLILAALLACLIPARRAARVDPVVALRHE
ncbi:MAG TPA: ABC transporter permease [Vicinamibacterales bacterium]|nr:ABC transporter permease [Vicinamibacterales bacterium]